MKHIVPLLLVCLMTNCIIPSKKQISNPKARNELVSKSDTLDLNFLIKKFDTKYKIIIKELNDSISKYKTDDIDFSNLTGGLERKYDECSNEIEKVLLGYKLAGNYMIHYDSTKKMEYLQKAESLFYSFLSYNDGILASKYMKLDLKKVQFLQKDWGIFSDKDKETVLFYGLLRGFDYGLPEILEGK